MANVGSKLMGSGTLKGGASKTLTWNNPPSQNVWAFSVVPNDVPDNEFLPGTIAFEITNVVYQLIAPGKRKILVAVKNNSAFEWGFSALLAWISA